VNHKEKDSKQEEPQLELDFETIIRGAEVRSRDEIALLSDAATSTEYNPVAQTAEYMRRAIQFEEAWDTTISKAREALLKTDAKSLYLDFLTDLQSDINRQGPRAARLAEVLNYVSFRGLGLDSHQVRISNPARGATKWRVQLDLPSIESHLERHIIGPNFLTEIRASENRWRGRSPLIAASDVSQHVSAVPIPARFFKRSVPFVLNNAAGALFLAQGAEPKYNNLFNPKPDEALLRWMLIDPSYQEELEPEDYRRCLGSAMDVGQFKFDLDYLLKTNKRTPDVIFRDGSLFPQDAYLENLAIDNRRGEFTREAIREMLSCLSYVAQVKTIYCGVAKSVQLKVYSAVLDWFITRNIDQSWEVGSYSLTDGLAMSLLLSSPSFVNSNLSQLIATCLIRRSFTTRANLNTRIAPDGFADYCDAFQERNPDIDITPYRRLCEIAHVYMFYMGHSKSPQQQLPRYEFFYHEKMGRPEEIAASVLGALQSCSLMPDKDHSFMSDQPIVYLMPSVTQQAHHLSKDVGRHIDSMTGQWIMARYRQLLEKTR
jgi:hypothetical protein